MLLQIAIELCACAEGRYSYSQPHQIPNREAHKKTRQFRSGAFYHRGLAGQQFIKRPTVPIGPTASARVYFIVPGRQQKLKYAMWNYTPAFKSSIFPEKLIASHLNCFKNARIVKLFRSTRDVHRINVCDSRFAICSG
jgi:hypothetical protein